MKSNDFYDPTWVEKVTLPIKRVDGRWEFLYGGDVPVKDGTFAEMTLNTAALTDQRFLERVTQEIAVKVLQEGASLYVALRDRTVAPQLKKDPWPKISREHIPIGTTRFERIFLGPAKISPYAQKESRLFAEDGDTTGGLWLKLKGLDKTELASSTITLPEGVADGKALSLNHAYTLLSKHFEAHRMSNTGNVYDQCFYEDTNGRLYPLGDLRYGIRTESERKLIAQTWLDLEVMLGWRPLIQDKRRRRKQG